MSAAAARRAEREAAAQPSPSRARTRQTLIAAIAPRRMSVEGDFNVRGGIHTTVVAQHP